MRKRISLLLALAALVVGLFAAPAQAFGNDAIVWCVGPTSPCFNVQGLAADVRSYHESGTSNGGQLFGSLYLHDKATDDFVELGIANLKGASGAWTDYVFLAQGNIACGASCYSWVWNTSGVQGVYRLLLSRIGARGSGDYQIWWDEPGQARQTLSFYNLAYAPYAAAGETAAEHSVASDPMPDFHANTWVRSESTGYPWYAANGSRAMDCVYDTVGNHKTLYYPGSGSTGDEMVYYPAVGNCP